MNKSIRISLLIGFIVLLGSVLTGLITFNAYNKVLKSSTRSIAELSTMGVYSEINSELTKPIYVSLTMAHDSFVKEWLENEDTRDETDIIEYLNGVYQKYEYNSVFLVSSNTGNYYHYNGIHKTVDPNNDHDIWYYDFLEHEQEYDLDVDVDEVTGILTIFVNVKMYDSLGNITAVVGVGVEMDYVKDIMTDFEHDYDLRVYLTNQQGLIQSSTNIQQIEQKNMFDEFEEDITSKILASDDDLVTITKNNESRYIISRYVDELDWYLIVTKDTNIFEQFFMDYFYISFIMILAVLGVITGIIVVTINSYQSKIYTLAKTDYLTLLLNRRGFHHAIEDLEQHFDEALVFICDIDRFKRVNDEYGHAEGDVVLRRLAKIIDTEVRVYGQLSRWGGDEFTGYMFGEKAVLEQTLKNIYQTILSDPYLSEKQVTISLGYSYTMFDEDIDHVLARADRGLYEAKNSGGNTMIYVKKDL